MRTIEIDGKWYVQSSHDPVRYICLTACYGESVWQSFDRAWAFKTQDDARRYMATLNRAYS